MLWENKISELLENRHHKIRVGSKGVITPWPAKYAAC